MVFRLHRDAVHDQKFFPHFWQVFRDINTISNKAALPVPVSRWQWGQIIVLKPFYMLIKYAVAN